MMVQYTPVSRGNVLSVVTGCLRLFAGRRCPRIAPQAELHKTNGPADDITECSAGPAAGPATVSFSIFSF